MGGRKDHEVVSLDDFDLYETESENDFHVVLVGTIK